LRDVRHAFLGLCIDAGQKVLAALMESDRIALCGPKGVPDAQRRAVRGGSTASQVVLGGQRIAVRRPRARSLSDGELALPSFEWAASGDPLDAATLAEQERELRQFGKSKEGPIARQVMLGVVQTAEGLPLYHEVFDGNTAEVRTLRPTIEKIVQRFPVKRVIAVADRGLLSVDQLEELQAITLPGGSALEFILAVPGRRYAEFVELLEPLQRGFVSATEEVLGETRWNGLRLVVAHDPHAAQQAGAERDALIAELEAKAQAWAQKLQAQDAGQTARGRKLSDGGATARLYREVCDAHMARILRVDLGGELFSYDIDEQALAHARLMDGKLLLVTNATDLTPAEVVQRYKSLADIERGFRVLKSEIEIGPIFHRLPNRIRAHAAICFIALILHRVMRIRLKASSSNFSPERALQHLRRIQHHRVTLNGSAPAAGLSNIDKEQAAILSALTVGKPTLTTQLTLL
ncbi:MAG: IS1634 family transposase, partial [Rubrivivax sp.]|nr:IS1634 family transposase [Rubrivivax sp.]